MSDPAGEVFARWMKEPEFQKADEKSAQKLHDALKALWLDNHPDFASLKTAIKNLGAAVEAAEEAAKKTKL